MVTAQAPSLVRTIKDLVSIASGIASIGSLLLTKTWPWFRDVQATRSLRNDGGVHHFTQADLELAIRNYVSPDCTRTDPESAGGLGERLSLFDELDAFLKPACNDRYMFVLGESGTGKTSALINYYARLLRRFSRPLVVHIVPLGIDDPDGYVRGLPDPRRTLLMMDGLEEDQLAAVDTEQRVRDLLELTQGFAKVIITSRTQFFPSERALPTTSGVRRRGPRAGGIAPEFPVRVLYLAPFSTDQVQAFLRKLYSVWRVDLRTAASGILTRVEALARRPMLLTRIDEMLWLHRQQGRVPRLSQLYEFFIREWIIRERGVAGADKLWEFSERLAVELYRRRNEGGAERIRKDQLAPLAQAWSINLDEWEMSSGSLLNRDAAGNYKFSHRTIMEYLYVRRFSGGDLSCLGDVWTDGMILFLRDSLAELLLHDSTGRLETLINAPARWFEGILVDPAGQLLLSGFQSQPVIQSAVSLVCPDDSDRPVGDPLILMLAATALASLRVTRRAGAAVELYVTTLTAQSHYDSGWNGSVAQTMACVVGFGRAGKRTPAPAYIGAHYRPSQRDPHLRFALSHTHDGEPSLRYAHAVPIEYGGRVFGCILMRSESALGIEPGATTLSGELAWRVGRELHRRGFWITREWEPAPRPNARFLSTSAEEAARAMPVFR